MIERIYVIDQITVTEFNSVQVRQATRLVEDGEVLSETYARWVLEPGDDFSEQTPKVQAVCNSVWGLLR